MKWLLVAIIRGYQLVLSPFLGQTCRYYPSCSAYAVTALQNHGAVRGSWLAVRRLLRCHPWAPGGVDHVPPPRGTTPPGDDEIPSPTTDHRPAAASGPSSQQGA